MATDGMSLLLLLRCCLCFVLLYVLCFWLCIGHWSRWQWTWALAARDRALAASLAARDDKQPVGAARPIGLYGPPPDAQSESEPVSEPESELESEPELAVSSVSFLGNCFVAFIALVVVVAFMAFMTPVALMATENAFLATFMAFISFMFESSSASRCRKSSRASTCLPTSFANGDSETPFIACCQRGMFIIAFGVLNRLGVLGACFLHELLDRLEPLVQRGDVAALAFQAAMHGP